jgi:beta-phosphoglucomutase-like phosphatase (HAD superfamily)
MSRPVAKNKMIQTVIFDMDGVIVDTEPVHAMLIFNILIKVTEEMFTLLKSTRNVFSKFSTRSRSGRPDSEKEDHIQ